MRAIVCVLLLGSNAVLAAEPSEAERLYQQGKEKFRAGRFEEALADFNLGYEKAPRPEFLFNQAQCHRQLGRTDEAIRKFEQFIAAAPTHPLRGAAEGTLAELRRNEKVAPSPSLTPTPAISSPAPQPSRRPGRRTAVWVTVGIAAAAAITGAALGIYYGTRDQEHLIGTVKLMPQ